jgi:purine-nucleoside phosphorylase
MESGCLFTLASLYGIRAGTICTVSDRCPWASPGQDVLSLDRNMTGCIEVAVQAALALAGKG